MGYVSPEEASELVTAGLQRMGHTEAAFDQKTLAGT